MSAAQQSAEICFFISNQRGEENDGDVGGGVVCLEITGDVAAVGFGHHDVEEDDIGFEFSGGGDGVESIVFFADFILPGLLERHAHHEREVRLVVHDQDSRFRWGGHLCHG